MRTFEVSEEEFARFKEWDEKHTMEKHGERHPYSGAIGGRITWQFTGTSLGQIVSVKCGLCDEEHCLTDFSDW